MAETLTYPELVARFIQAVVTYSPELTYFGENGANAALARADASLGAQHQGLHRALLRRFTLIGATGEDLVQVASEYGTPKRDGVRARMLVVLRPHVANVTAISGNSSLLEVDDSSKFAVNDSIRVRSNTGTTEIATIAAITTGTGPNGGDELDVGSLVNNYLGATSIAVLLRKTVPEGTVIQTQAGIDFQTLADVTVGDLNPVLDGESSSLSLNDKVIAEATVKGEAGNVERETVTGLQTPDPDIKDVLNPERASGGRNVESDYELKRRASHQAQDGAIETQAYFEAVAKQGNRDVLRVFLGASGSVSSMQLIVMGRNGAGLSTDALNALEDYIGQRVRSDLAIELVNATPTSVEIEATVTLEPGAGTAAERLKAAYIAAADSYAAFLDFRKWNPGVNVDEADLLSILNGTPGIATVQTATFSPAADVEVGDTSVPIFTRLSITDETSSLTEGADLTPEF